jgi:glycosyltransferase involved in cell wall biosynthesis
MRIGIVLTGVPAYSETFFRNKIKFLQERNGVDVILFADRQIPELRWSLCNIVYGRDDGRSGVLFRVTNLIKIFLTHPDKTSRLFVMNLSSGFSLRENIQSITRSAHIFTHTLDWLHYGFGTMAIGRENVARVMKAKMAVSFRGFDHYIYPLKNPGCYTRIYRTTDKFHVLSEAMKLQLVAAGNEISKIEVITPAIDIEKFNRREPAEKLYDGILKLVTVARLHWTKGLAYTLEGLAILKERGINFRYTIIGEGSERERLMFLAHQFGMSEQVDFCGRKESLDVIEYLRKGEIYIQYSIQEGFCNAALEAQAMGLLCVVSDADGLVENVVHNETGWVIPKRNPHALANQLHAITLMTSEKLDDIRVRARSRIVEDFSLLQQAKKFQDFYKQVE